MAEDPDAITDTCARVTGVSTSRSCRLEHGVGAEEANRFPPVKRLKVVADGDTLRVGSLAVTAHLTPGHTPGSDQARRGLSPFVPSCRDEPVSGSR
jgi:hypothetical protein